MYIIERIDFYIEKLFLEAKIFFIISRLHVAFIKRMAASESSPEIDIPVQLGSRIILLIVY